MELKEICDYIHNYFEQEVKEGEFTITGGALADSSFILENQYYRIEGSTFNDGIYKHPTTDLTDETFKGAITLMAVPKDVLKVLADATQWETDNAADLKMANKPFNSESFAGYSYSKGTSTKKDGSTGTYSWRDVFGDKLKAYRKIG